MDWIKVPSNSTETVIESGKKNSWLSQAFGREGRLKSHTDVLGTVGRLDLIDLNSVWLVACLWKRLTLGGRFSLSRDLLREVIKEQHISAFG